VAGGLVLAGVVRRADVEVRRELAMGSVEPSGAGTSVIILDPGLAVSAVLAGSLLTLVLHPRLTVASGEADRAGASVVLPCVEAGGPVVARLVLRAEVEVDVAEVAPPPAVALAGVRLAAGSVLAPGVDLALVAVRPGPPDATLALVWLVAESVLAAAAGRTLG
jgi:hypothetical protein